MKTVVDYLKKNKKYEHDVMDADFELELEGDIIKLRCNEEEWSISTTSGVDAEYDIQEILEEHEIEIRFCEICGIPMDQGYTTDCGGWYCCEDCFEGAMDEDYGKGKWRGTDEDGIDGGFYEALDEDDEWEDTGVYWTQWY